MPKKVGKVQLHIGPSQLGGPGDLESTSTASTNAQKKLAKYPLDEIDRIIAHHAQPI